MSGETQSNESAWTTDSLKEKTEGDVASLERFLLQQIKDIREDYDRRFIANETDKNRRFASSEKAVETAFKAANEAVTKSELGVEKRADSVYVTITKLQGALADVMPRKEAEERFKSLSKELTANTTKTTLSEGTTKGSQLTMGKFYAAIGAVGAILAITILLANNVFR